MTDVPVFCPLQVSTTIWIQIFSFGFKTRYHWYPVQFLCNLALLSLFFLIALWIKIWWFFHWERLLDSHPSTETISDDTSMNRWINWTVGCIFQVSEFFLCHFASLKVRFQRLHFLVRQHLVSSETWVGASNSPLTHCSSGSEDDTTHKHTGGHTKQSHQFYTCSCTSCTDSKF